MNAAHWHLVLVHIPIILSPLASALLLFGMLRGHEILRRLAFLLLVVCGLASGAAFLTGDGAEEILEHAAGVSEALIEPHEEAAEVVLWLSAISGIISAAALVLRSGALVQKLCLLVLLISSAASAGLGYTGYLGGKIRHPETGSTPQTQLEDEQDDD